MSLELGILGALEVRADGRAVEVRSAKQRELLGALVVNAGEVISRDRLIDALWVGSPPDTASKALQVHVSQLRKLAVPIETRAPGYLLHVDGDHLDAVRFERLAREGSDALAAGDPDRAAALLREALALWRGPALADLAYADFAQPEIARLEELRLAALEDRIDADLALGRGDVVSELEGLVARHPFRERLRRQLMLALYRSGRQAEALDAYRDAHRVLGEELGIEPSPDLRQLERAILVQDPALAPRPARTARREDDDFVGRERELDALLARLDDAIAGRGGLVLLSGEAGIGKSRLMEELSARAGARGGAVLVGRCWEAGGAPPFWPWVDALRGYADGVPAEAGPLPELGAPPTAPGVDPEVARFQLFDATAAFLAGAARAQPILLVLDDVHGADASSLLLLRFLAQQLGDLRMLVVAAYRDDEVGPEHPLAVADLLRAPGTSRVELGGLGPGDVERYLARTTGRVDLAGRIHADTEGNPLFVAEISRLLAEGGTWERRMPQGVRDVIGRRLHRLSADTRELLATASVIGREFRLLTLERLAGASRDEALDAIDEAVAAHVIEELPVAGTLRFSHALVRDALYDDLPPARRARLHRRAGTTLEAIYGADLEPHLAELAHHFCAAADASNIARAIDYAQRAARRAADQLAYEEAERLYALALAVLERETPHDAERQCRLLLLLGDAQTRGGEGADARSTYDRAARIAAQAGLPELQAEAALAYIGRFLWMRSASDPRLVPLIEEALAALGEVERPLRAKLLSRLVPSLRGGELDWGPRAELGERAVEMARRMGDPATLAYVLDARCGGLEGPHTLEQTLVDAEEIIALGKQLGDKERVFGGVEHRFWARLTLGDASAALADHDTMLRLAEELRQPSHRWIVTVDSTTLALLQGRLDEAERLIAEAYALGSRAQSWSPKIEHDLQLFALRSEQGRLPELREHVDEWIAERPGYRIFGCLKPLCEARSGRMPQAAEALGAVAADGFSGISPDEQWLWGASLAAEASVVLDAAEHAGVLLELLRPFADLIVMSLPEVAAGSVARFLGMLAGALERWDDAEEYFEAALAKDTATGARPAAAHDRREAATVLLRRGRPGDPGRARALLAEAAGEYDAMGMAVWAGAARALA